MKIIKLRTPLRGLEIRLVGLTIIFGRAIYSWFMPESYSCFIGVGRWWFVWEKQEKRVYATRIKVKTKREVICCDDCPLYEERYCGSLHQPLCNHPCNSIHLAEDTEDFDAKILPNKCPLREGLFLFCGTDECKNSR